MNTGQRAVAGMLAVVAALPLLTGCSGAPTWRAYTGPKLPDEQTALIVNGSTVDTFGGAGAFIVKIDGVTSPVGARELFTYRGAIRMLPGTHDMEVRFLEQRGAFYGSGWAAPRNVTLNAKAGRTYSLHERDNYTSERIEAIARDGTKVPVSLVYRNGFEKDSTSPLLLYGYGSYGASMDARFNSSALSLLDRDFVYAIAHIRGGQELGRAWYEDGKLDKKMNTFTDFIDVGDHLVRAGYADPQRVFALGGSAGGLLMGAVANMRPDLFKGMVAAVPFVDVVTTMLDDSIPLTTSEYDEWGNPNEKDAYDYMLAYSPYDNVAKQRYPNLLVTTGLHDSQVQYWEPAKWVAKLRAMKTDTNRLILRTNMDAGHGGKSGRFRRFEEQAYTYAFLLDLAGHTATD